MYIKLNLFISVFAVLCISSGSFANRILPVRLMSPDNKILYEFDIRDGKAGYSVAYQGRKLIEFSILNLLFKNDSLIQGVHLLKAVRLDSGEQYTLITGRSNLINDPFHQLTLFLKEKNPAGRLFQIQVRVFDDGIAFRYIFPKETGDSLFLRQEKSGFQIAGNPFVHVLVFADYLSSHEGNYLHRFYRDLPKDSLMDMPALFEYSDHVYLAITEAGTGLCRHVPGKKFLRAYFQSFPASFKSWLCCHCRIATCQSLARFVNQ